MVTATRVSSPDRAYLVETKFLDGVEIWLKNKLQAVAVNRHGQAVATSRFEKGRLFGIARYIFLDNDEKILFFIKQHRILFKPEVYFPAIQSFKLSFGRKLSIPEVGTEIECDNFGFKVRASALPSTLAVICLGYFCWLRFVRWSEMD